MGRTPRVTAAEIIRVIEQLGFSRVRSSGSHFIYRNAEGRRTTVPFHPGEILHPKTLSAILRDVGLTPEELSKRLS